MISAGLLTGGGCILKRDAMCRDELQKDVGRMRSHAVGVTAATIV
jgi:hypothetical protein